MKTLTRHPARYTDALLPIFAQIIPTYSRGLDPFGGTGKIFEIERYVEGVEIECVEIEPEWAAYDNRITVGDALALPWSDSYFDWICTSPCLAHGQRILRKDLRWVGVESINEGDQVIAFDENDDGLKANGAPRRRKWRIATVIRSVTKNVDCVRVHLSNGESIVCTPEHPWLAQRYKRGGNNKVGHVQWVQAKDLISRDTYTRRVHGKPMEIPKKQTGWWVHKQLDVWSDDMSYDAGWLAGIFDGEGSLSFGAHGSPKLMVTQVEGQVTELIKLRMNSLGIDFSTLLRTGTPAHRQSIYNIYVKGGFPAILKTLGRIRPARLISKLDKLNISSRSIDASRKVQVIAVEHVGKRDIQEIETSTGTYIGEGYLHHNCYGNRMADHHEARDCSRRNTYRHALNRPLHPANAGQLQYGAEYQKLHRSAWAEAWRVLRPGGLFILNIKDHIRRGERVNVTQFHEEALRSVGFTWLGSEQVKCPGNRFGQNGGARIEYETVAWFQKPERR